MAKTLICKCRTKKDRMAMAKAHHDGRHGQREEIDNILIYWAEGCPDCYFELLEKGYFG